MAFKMKRYFRRGYMQLTKNCNTYITKIKTSHFLYFSIQPGARLFCSSCWAANSCSRCHQLQDHHQIWHWRKKYASKKRLITLLFLSPWKKNIKSPIDQNHNLWRTYYNLTDKFNNKTISINSNKYNLHVLWC